MFQTELIIFLQSFASEYLTAFFKFFTEIGKSEYAAPLVLIVMFGISFRVGFILLHAVSWNGLITYSLKEIFALPRPSNVDIHVKLLGETAQNITPFESMGGKHFFGGFPKDILGYIRIHPFDSWGFPSGHASHAVTLWGSISLYLKKTWLYVLTVLMIVFISLSRMYLGRHFLADVLGGLLLGLIMMLVFYRGVYQNKPLSVFLFERRKKTRISIEMILFFFYFFCVPFLVLIIPGVPLEQVAALLGLNLGFVWIRHRGIPDDTGDILKRTGRVLLAGAVFFLIYAGLKRGIGFILSDEPLSVVFIRLVFSMFVSLWSSVEISYKLGLYKR